MRSSTDPASNVLDDYIIFFLSSSRETTDIDTTNKSHLHNIIVLNPCNEANIIIRKLHNPTASSNETNQLVTIDYDHHFMEFYFRPLCDWFPFGDMSDHTKPKLEHQDTEQRLVFITPGPVLFNDIIIGLITFVSDPKIQNITRGRLLNRVEARHGWLHIHVKISVHLCW